MAELTPIILCHPACSGGSMIYRMLISSFRLTGLSEVSHCFQFGKYAFNPTDPELALMRSGVIGEHEFGKIFFDRILRAHEICKGKGERLLIREHTHSYFFGAAPGFSIPSNPSWIAAQYLAKYGEPLKCILTVRDPIDSWLGLQANFPKESPPSFNDYCTRYKTLIGTYDDMEDPENTLLIRYEDIIEDSGLQLRKIAKLVGVRFDGMLPEDWNNVASTGNSGRQSSIIEMRSRRPYGRQMIREAQQSQSYRHLTERLAYPHLCDSLSTRQHFRAMGVDWKRSFASRLLAALDPIQEWAKKKSNVR